VVVLNFILTKKNRLAMKNLISLFTLLCFFLSAFGQITVSQQTLNQDADSIHVYQYAAFPFGSGPTCPNLDSFELTGTADTSVLELYYNIGGFWPTNFCSSRDTLSFRISDFNNCNLKILTIPYVHDYYYGYDFNPIDTFYRDTMNLFEICGVTDASSPFIEDQIEIIPNPVHQTFKIINKGNEDIRSVKLYDVKGSLIRTLNIDENSVFDIKELPEAIYLLQVSTKNGTFSKLLLKT